MRKRYIFMHLSMMWRILEKKKKDQLNFEYSNILNY